jgi:hypothetical protein
MAMVKRYRSTNVRANRSNGCDVHIQSAKQGIIHIYDENKAGQVIVSFKDTKERIK